jgi:hypothetical protein
MQADPGVSSLSFIKFTFNETDVALFITFPERHVIKKAKN